MVGHGGDVYAAARQLRIPEDSIIDFSASINPLGTPASVMSVLRRHLKRLRHYPDPSATGLVQEIAKSTGLDPRMILCGNGSTELIYLVARAFRPERVLIPAPAFAEYERACIAASHLAGNHSNNTGIKYFHIQAMDKFRLNADAFKDAMKDCDMAFICNPNNPTGQLVRKSDMVQIADAARKSGCCLVVDEAFIDFIPGESIIKKVAKNPSLIVIRSLTKFYALSGLRIGYAVINRELLDAISRHKEPWTVNSLAQVAGVASLKDTAYQSRSLTVLKDEKSYLEKGFRRLGIDYYPSCANFYLLKCTNAYNIVVRLREKGILVRDCSNFKGLDHSYIRIAVRTRIENKRLLAEFAKI
ncbi:MAG: threonine-phosphate decarboxylase CobD [Dissulfurispiraceae bacterium]